MFNALQELALNLDQKKNEVTELRKENDTLQDEIGQNKEESIKVNGKLDELKERELTQKKRVYECLQSIVTELAGLGDYTVPPKFTGESDKAFIEEDILAHVRIFVSKVASDSAQKLSQNESGSAAAKQLEVAEQEVQKLRVQVQQNETSRTAHETEITDLKTKVQKLEDEVTALNLKLAGSNAGGASSQAVEELRQMVQKKNDEIKSIQAKLQTLQTEKDQLQQEYERLKNDELLKEKRLKDLSALTGKPSIVYFMINFVFRQARANQTRLEGTGRNCRKGVELFAQSPTHVLAGLVPETEESTRINRW